MTYQTWLIEASGYLRGAGSLERAEAHVSARLLLDSITGTRFSHLLSPEAKLEAPQLEKLSQYLQEAARGRPLPYILGRAPFFGLEFEVDERVLIPRPETELLVEIGLEKLNNRAAPRLADLGTGSGAIAVSVAVSLTAQRRDAQIVALDISEGALEIAARNARRYGAEVQFVQGNGSWLSPLQNEAPFDAILSNPPYIPAATIETLEIGVREFEPRLALDGGRDGLNPYRELARGAFLLKKDGFMALELGAGQWPDVRDIFAAQGWKIEAARRDLAGIERVLVARRSE